MALHVKGDFAAADSVFAASLERMPSLVHCHWINLAPLLRRRHSGQLQENGLRPARGGRRADLVDSRSAVHDPRQRAAHRAFLAASPRRRYSRTQRTRTDRHGAAILAEADFAFWLGGEWTQEPAERIYTGAKPSITGHEREPGYHFFLTQRPPDSLALIVDSVFDIYQFPPREQYAPTYARAFQRLDAQVARFRRGDSTRVVAAYDVTSDTLFGNRKFAAAVVAMGDESDVSVDDEARRFPGEERADCVDAVEGAADRSRVAGEGQLERGTMEIRVRRGAAGSGKISVSICCSWTARRLCRPI